MVRELFISVSLTRPFELEGNVLQAVYTISGDISTYFDMCVNRFGRLL